MTVLRCVTLKERPYQTQNLGERRISGVPSHMWPRNKEWIVNSEAVVNLQLVPVGGEVSWPPLEKWACLAGQIWDMGYGTLAGQKWDLGNRNGSSSIIFGCFLPFLVGFCHIFLFFFHFLLFCSQAEQFGKVTLHSKTESANLAPLTGKNVGRTGLNFGRTEWLAPLWKWPSYAYDGRF